MPTATEQIDQHRRQIETASGPASCIDTGGPGRPAVFVHGLGTSSYLWRHVIERLDRRRRCVAVDLPLHGQTPAAAGQDLSLPGLARFVADCCDSLQITDIDLVANDTGGAVAQVFAAGHSDRLHTLALTNCETHDNVPPPALRPAYLLARADQASRIGLLARVGAPGWAARPQAGPASTGPVIRTQPACPTTSPGPGSNRSSPPRTGPANICGCLPRSGHATCSPSNPRSPI